MTNEQNDPLIIDVKNLTKVYGDKTVVDNISLQVKQGDIYGFWDLMVQVRQLL